MEIILSEQCESLTGSLGRGFGYYIRSFYCRRKNVTHYYAQRSKHSVPPDGHWRFILTCAELAQNRMHIVDIRVSANELRSAFDEANILYGDRLVKADARQIYNAHEVIDFKNWCSL